ncbi:hypothetical protein LMG27177_03076 [Paraburkholderia fynbosensis]|uniref:Uncharacterized protein n=1 Tax=Paraburkholderia fynbosensis TaxID=1200993 RepID=A0A6J5G846_9BURK|nr:hypothetical protein LMG27177_03076 [Paraburkholderia fynbosensis]
MLCYNVSGRVGVLFFRTVENEYADVIAQIGGKYVQVSAIETDPDTDPHTFEVNPKVAAQIVSADLIVKNGHAGGCEGSGGRPFPLNPAQAACFQASEKKFDASLKPWLAAIASFKAHYSKTPVAVTEPVASYMLEAVRSMQRAGRRTKWWVPRS